MPIPKAIRDVLNDDPWMKHCILDDTDCGGALEWNHGLSYAGRRVNELYSLVPMCAYHHRREARYRAIIAKEIEGRIKHFNAEDEFRQKYPRSTLL